MYQKILVKSFKSRLHGKKIVDTIWFNSTLLEICWNYSFRNEEKYFLNQQ